MDTTHGQRMRPMFQGTLTALITPFTAEGALDEAGLRLLVRRQIDGGVDGLVPCGTTGETPSLSDDEVRAVIRITVEECAGRIPVLAGAGSYSTQATVAKVEAVRALGADGALVVTPYYNKPTASGLLRHFTAVAEAAAGYPIVLYNVPSRTGSDMPAEVALELARLPGVVGIKEASGDLFRAMDILRAAPEGFTLLSGDDPLTYSLAGLGGAGVISVTSNLVPERVVALTDACLEGRWDDARALHYQLLDLSRTLFIETSPAPTKAALSMLGLPGGGVRSPLAPLLPMSEVAVRRALEAQGLLGGRS